MTVNNCAISENLIRLNDNELRAVNCLLAYISLETQWAHDRVLCALQGRFGVQKVSELPQRSYEEVIDFLMSLGVDDKAAAN